MGLQMTGDVGCTQHLPTDATGDLAFMSDHVRAESVFGGESGGTGLQSQDKCEWDTKKQEKKKSAKGNLVVRALTVT